MKKIVFLEGKHSKPNVYDLIIRDLKKQGLTEGYTFSKCEYTIDDNGARILEKIYNVKPDILIVEPVDFQIGREEINIFKELKSGKSDPNNSERANEARKNRYNDIITNLVQHKQDVPTIVFTLCSNEKALKELQKDFDVIRYPTTDSQKAIINLRDSINKATSS